MTDVPIGAPYRRTSNKDVSLHPRATHDVTALLHAWSDGDIAARDRLMALIYRELRRR